MGNGQKNELVIYEIYFVNGWLNIIGKIIS